MVSALFRGTHQGSVSGPVGWNTAPARSKPGSCPAGHEREQGDVEPPPGVDKQA